MSHQEQSPSQSPTRAWGFGAPEKIDVAEPAEVNWAEAAKFSEERVKVIESVRQILKQEEEQFVGKERAFLENSIKFLETFHLKAHEFIEEEENHIRGLKAEITRHAEQQEHANKEVDEAKAAIHTLEHKIAAEHTEQQGLINFNRIGELGGLVNVVELGKIKLKDSNDVSNDVFRWVHQVLYQGTRDNYDWNAFKKAAFTSDKGKGFTAKLRTLDARSLKREDFIIAKNVFERREEILKGFEPKGKENVPARRLFDYIGNVVQIGDYHDLIQQDRQVMEQKEKELSGKEINAAEIAQHLKPTEEKVQVSERYIETLRELQPSVHDFIGKIKERVNIQDQYVETIRGNIQEIDPMGQSVYKTKQGDELQEGCEFEHNEAHVKQTEDDREVAAHEEEGLQGDGVEDAHGRKSQRSAAPQIDLKESEFANSKRGSCESCSMF